MKIKPQGKYMPVSRNGSIVITSGITPRVNGELVYTGKLNTKTDISEYRDALRLATENAVTAVNNTINRDEEISSVINLTIYLQTENDFYGHSAVADFSSEYLFEILRENGIGSRAVIGVSSLPKNALVEIVLQAEIKKRRK